MAALVGAAIGTGGTVSRMANNALTAWLISAFVAPPSLFPRYVSHSPTTPHLRVFLCQVLARHLHRLQQLSSLVVQLRQQQSQLLLLALLHVLARQRLGQVLDAPRLVALHVITAVRQLEALPVGLCICLCISGVCWRVQSTVRWRAPGEAGGTRARRRGGGSHTMQ